MSSRAALEPTPPEPRLAARSRTSTLARYSEVSFLELDKFLEDVR